MIDDEKYCIDILTQISAVTSALETVAVGVLDDHLRQCVADAARAGGPEGDAKITEASQAIARLVRSWYGSARCGMFARSPVACSRQSHLAGQQIAAATTRGMIFRSEP